MNDIMSCKMIHAASGGVTHFGTTTTDAPGGVMTVGAYFLLEILLFHGR
jgi:hypothetical protein